MKSIYENTIFLKESENNDSIEKNINKMIEIVKSNENKFEDIFIHLIELKGTKKFIINYTCVEINIYGVKKGFNKSKPTFSQTKYIEKLYHKKTKESYTYNEYEEYKNSIKKSYLKKFFYYKKY